MGQELVVPDSFKSMLPAQAFAGLNAQDDTLAAGIGQSYGVIGYKGKVWSLRHRGERHNIIRPDDGTPSSYLDVIILGQARMKSKSFYKKFDPGTSDGDRPICASIDGVVPDADVTQKQCDSCALCPRNVWKTDPQTGRKGRECTDYKRLAVLVLPTQTKPILGEPLLEPVFLRVPPASLNSLAIMGETMANQGMHFSTYITRISFDPSAAHPQMVFRPLQPLTDKEAPVILELRASSIVGRITGGDVALGTMKAVEQAVEPSTATMATVAGLTASAPAQPTTIAQPFTGAGGVVQTSPSETNTSAPPATPSTPQPTPSTSSSTPSTVVDTGFGGVTDAITVSAPALTVADAGEPEESDAALDARIASLISAR